MTDAAVRSVRTRLIAAVHVAAKKHDIDDDMRRDLMQRVTGKRSAAAMTVVELGRVLDAIHGGKQSPPGDPAWRRKIRALWISAHQLGLVRDPADTALDAFVQRQADVSALRFLPAARAQGVIEALKNWLERDGGVDWAWPADADDRERIAIAMFRRLGAAGVTTGEALACNDYCRMILGIHQCRSLSPAEWSRVLPILAQRLAKAEGRDQ